MTKQEQSLARKLPGYSQIERVRAARAIIESRCGNEGLALEGFMAIFHPEYTMARVKELRRAMRSQP